MSDCLDDGLAVTVTPEMLRAGILAIMWMPVCPVEEPINEAELSDALSLIFRAMHAAAPLRRSKQADECVKTLDSIK